MHQASKLSMKATLFAVECMPLLGAVLITMELLKIYLVFASALAVSLLTVIDSSPYAPNNKGQSENAHSRADQSV